MATVVFFHAHPDDEAIATGGTMAALAAAGHRVVLVHATLGEHGEVADGFLEPGETLGQRRAKEVEAVAAVLNVARHEALGYRDSGMMGTPENDDPRSFWQADLDEAAGRLAAILREEQADVLTVYDANGNYGHPDHIQVHRVGVRAAELAGTARVYEATTDRDAIMEMMRQAPPPEVAADVPEAPVDPIELGVPGEVITTRVDVSAWLDVKRKAMAVHASQISETSFFLAMPEEMFAAVWGTEWYIRRDVPSTHRESSLVDGL